MDRKSIIVLVVSFLLLMAWYPLMEKLGYIKPPPPRGTNQTVRATGEVDAAGAPARPEVPVLQSAPASPTLTSLAPLPGGPERAAEEVLIWEGQQARYVFSSFGGGLKRAELREFPESIACRKKHGADTNNLATLNDGAPTPALAILADAGFMEDFQFQLRRVSDGVVAEKALTNGLRLLKEFRPGSNYLVHVVVRYENTSTNSIRVPPREWVLGTATPLESQDQALLTGLQWYNGSKAERVTESWFANRTLGCIPGVPRLEYAAGDANVGWAAVHNQFFTMAAVPASNALQVAARKVELAAPPPTNGKPAAVSHGFQTAFRYAEQWLGPGQAFEQRMDLYVGPKKYHVLATLGGQMRNNLDLVMEFDGFFGWFAKALLLSMNALAATGMSYGVAIVVITVIIKLLFWPLTAASTRSMKRMAALQPQMKAIQDKYKGEPQKMNQKMAEFMKENKINPLGGCLPILLQIPVFFGFYKMLQSAIELRGASFLWACDLSKTDTVWEVPVIGFPINPLPLLMGATMLWQARLTPMSPGMDPVQQKIMKYMPLMFMVFLYNFSAGLTLYWTVQNLISIAQMKMTRSDEPKPGAPAVAAARPAAPASPAAGGGKRKKKGGG